MGLAEGIVTTVSAGTEALVSGFADKFSKTLLGVKFKQQIKDFFQGDKLER